MTMIERVVGPIKGYYIATYASEAGGPGEYVGYAKVCTAPPAEYWEARPVAKFAGRDVAPNAQDALEHAEQLAKLQIGNMPHPF